MKLLNIDANPKTVKGQSRGYMTAVLYLAPWRVSGVNVCPTAEPAGCNVSCLNTAGRGGIARNTFAPYGIEIPDNHIQHARIARTRLYVENRPEFMEQLVREISNFRKRAERAGLVPCVRLNGTSDIVWEREALYKTASDIDRAYSFSGVYTIFDRFPAVQFYDYTKLPKRLDHPLPANYHLSVSYSRRNARYEHMAVVAAREHGCPLVVVRRGPWPLAYDSVLADLVERSRAQHIVNGDTTDLRFLDSPHSLVILKAKGAAKRDTSGFTLPPSNSGSK